MSRKTRQIADDLLAIRRRERLFEVMNRPEMRRDTARDTLAVAFDVLAKALILAGAAGLAFTLAAILIS